MLNTPTLPEDGKPCHRLTYREKSLLVSYKLFNKPKGRHQFSLPNPFEKSEQSSQKSSSLHDWKSQLARWFWGLLSSVVLCLTSYFVKRASNNFLQK